MDTKTEMPVFLDLDSVLYWTGFKSADEKYWALVSASVAEGWELTEDLSYCVYPTRLSKTESQVFEIEASEIPALYWAHSRYENLVGIETSPFGEFTDQERMDHKAFFRKGRGWSFDLAIGFMVSTSGLPLPKCMGWAAKTLAHQVRAGLYDNVQEGSFFGPAFHPGMQRFHLQDSRKT
jgi:hypothetical protein